MKDLSKIVLLLILPICISGCFSADEEFWINTDGTVELEITHDLSSLYPILQFGISEDDKDPTSRFMKQILDNEKLDTTYIFKNLMAESGFTDGLSWDAMMDSIANSSSENDGKEIDKDMLVASMEEIGNLTMRLTLDKKSGLLKTSNKQKFDELKSAKSVGNIFIEVMQRIGGANGDSPFDDNDPMDLIMRKMFSARTLLSGSDDVLRVRRQGLDMSKVLGEANQIMEMINMMGRKDYSIKIHLPGKVQKISSGQGQKTGDKTVSIAIPYDDLFDPSKVLDLEIKFKAKRR